MLLRGLGMGQVKASVYGKAVFIRAVMLVLESIPIIRVSIIANYWIIGSMKF